MFSVRECVLIIFLMHNTGSNQSIDCLTGCKCFNDAAVCCLLNSKQSFTSITYSPADIQEQDVCSVSSNPQWPHNHSCLQTWRQLKILLTPYSWPNTTDEFKTDDASSCTKSLRRLLIIGNSDSDDGLVKLDATQFRNLLFLDPGSLGLRHFTVEHTSLAQIVSGFLDQLEAAELTDLEIRYNPALTSHGLGVGWLANANNLRLLDLSHNGLYSINLARWGLIRSSKSKLNTLDLSGNKISHLKPDTFRRVPNLIHLSLANNLLSSLTLDVFNGLYKLRLLDLQGNHLKLPGLYSPLYTAAFMLPELRSLKLSGNPLMVGYDSSMAHSWWLADSCPKSLTVLYLENINSSQSLVPQSAWNNSLRLPSIAWDHCESLSEIRLSQPHSSVCIDQSWLGLAPNSTTVPSKFRIYPTSLNLCPPRLGKLNILEPSTNKKSAPVRFTSAPHDGNGLLVLQPTLLPVHEKNEDSAYWPRVADHSTRLVRFRSTSFLSSWLILSLVLVFILVVFSIVAMSVVYCLRYQNRGSKHATTKVYPSPEHSDQRNQLLMPTPDLLNFPVDMHYHLSSIDHVHPQYIKYPPSSIPSPSRLSYHALMDPICLRPPLTQSMSNGDSGVDDPTSHSVQQSPIGYLANLGPSSARTSIRSNRRSRHQRRPRHTSMNCPSGSFSSLGSGHLPKRNTDTANLWLSSFGVSPQHLVNAATSTEDMSTEAASSSPDPTDACNVPSEKTTLIFPSENDTKM